MSNSKQMDMLHGSLMDKIMVFALPLAASSILQQLFNSADVAVAGKFAGPDALAAVGGNSPVINLLVNLFVGLSVGANVVIANYIGQKRFEQVKETVHTVITLALLSGIFLLFLGILIARPILMLIDTPSDVLELAVLYLKIYFIGMPFVMVYNFGSAILRSIGDTKKSLYCLIVSGVINVVLNLFLVIVFHLSVVGVAVATVVANVISAGMILYFLTHGDETIRVDMKRLTLKREQLWKIVKIGVPAGLQGVVFSLSNVCIQSAINGFGKHAVAGSAAALNYEYFTYFVTSAFSQAAVTFTSQNYAAKQYDRCKKVFRYSMLLGIAITGVMCAVFIIGRTFFISIYTDDAEAVQYAVIRLMHVELLEFMPCFYEVSGGALRGMGYSMLPAVLTVFGSCGLRIVWIYTVFRRYTDFGMLMNVYPFTWLVTTILVMGAYYLVWKRVKNNGIINTRP